MARKRITAATTMLLLGWLQLLGIWSACGMVGVTLGVDRSKFRTCEQTSFCRRHRRDKSHPASTAITYQLLRDSVQFHNASSPTTTTTTTAADADEPQQHGEAGAGGGGVWKSLQRRLLGHHHADNDKSNHQDPYVRGPEPTLTGRLEPVILSAANHNRPHGASSSSSSLQWSVTALSSGLLRMRVTELDTHRITYDALVLPEATLTLARRVHFLPDIPESVWTERKTVSAFPENYMALEYGDDNDDDNNHNQRWLLWIQLHPWTMTLYRRADLTIPLVQWNAEQMLHWEVQRTRQNDADAAAHAQDASTQSKNQDSERDAGKESDATEEKEIVGYWEDGLAIYADGTREEKKEVVVDEPNEEHRQLSQVDQDDNGDGDEEGLWEERFGSHTDSKPYGPMSVGLDLRFPGSRHLYGIPEHAARATLQSTIGTNRHFTEPYRLYNLDVFEYELNETMALYGHVPVIMSQSRAAGSVGVFYFNPTETFVDVAIHGGDDHDNNNNNQPGSSSSTTHWISESGVLDVFVMPGPDPATLYHQYALLTGTTPLPPMFSLGYHQCRWNYKDEKDVAMVHSKFEELDYPYDVLWLDIEHTDGKRYFTWDANLFPNPKEMQAKLAAQGRRMVTIIDPHIKRDNHYYIHKQATAKGLYIKDKDGTKDFDGWCWPGSSSYLDFTAEHVRSWWADQFAYNKYQGSTPTLFTWNDMNEPSVFNGPEVSMQKDLRNLQGHEHREWHNLYGMLFHRATAEGLVRRNPGQDIRPFVLSRSFFAGSQKYGAIWTGDNAAEWGHLEIAAPMLLSLNVAALSFVGADVGGFFGNPDAELFTRWYQAAAYQPFFRGHAHHDSKRREPWMFDDETLVRLRSAAMTRYALLPYIYTVFAHAERTGMPVMRMMWMQYPQTEELFGVDHQYLFGSDLLVVPVTKQGATDAEVQFPMDHYWYDVKTMELASGTIQAGHVHTQVVPADLDTIPVYQRGGSIIPRKLRLRRSTMMMKTDPYTLFIALDEKLQAVGALHMDDEVSFGYSKRAEFANAVFRADLLLGNTSTKTIANTVVRGAGWSQFDGIADDLKIERIVVMGWFGTAPTTLLVQETSESLDFTFDETANTLVIRKPELSAFDDWTIVLA